MEDLTIAVDDDLLAAAVEAVERRSRPPMGAMVVGAFQFEQPDSLPPDDPTQDGLGGSFGHAERSETEVDIDLDPAEPAEPAEPPAPHAAKASPSQFDFGFLTEEWSRLEAELSAVRIERDDLLRVSRFGDEERRRLAAQLTRSVDRGRILERDINLATDARRGLEQRVTQLAEQCERQDAALVTLRERRRREIEDQRLFGNSSMLQEMLPVVDNLRRAASFADPDAAGVQKGVRMVLTQFLQTMAGFGVTLIDATPGAAFDPSYHEALAHHLVGPEHESGRIVEEITPGYLLNGRLLRAAQVTVSVRLAAEVDGAEDGAAMQDGAGSGDRPISAAASQSVDFASDSSGELSAGSDNYHNLFGDPNSDVGDSQFAPFDPSNSMPGDLGKDGRRPESNSGADDSAPGHERDADQSSASTSSSGRKKGTRRARNRASAGPPSVDEGPTFPGDDPQ